MHISPPLLLSKSSPCPSSPLPLLCGSSSLSLTSLTSANFVALRIYAPLLEGTISRFLTASTQGEQLSLQGDPPVNDDGVDTTPLQTELLAQAFVENPIFHDITELIDLV